MTDKPHVSQSVQYAEQIIAEREIYSNSFFTSLKDGSMTLEEFRKTQVQFYSAVLFFARPMTALIARFPHPATRLTILENVVEEHGDFSEKAFHESTFKEFLQSIDVDISNIAEIELWPEIRSFNSTLMTACIFDEPEVGVACLGVIEYMFAEISAIIGRTVVARNWCSEEKLVHYKLHSTLDRRHAREFFDIIEDKWQDKTSSYMIKQGIEMGVYIFNRLYEDLYYSSHRGKRNIPA